MIRIVKKYGKWVFGDKPNVAGGYAEELVRLKIAEWLDDSKNKVKKIETKKITKE